MTMGRRNTRFRVHYLLTLDKGTPAEKHEQSLMDISVFTPEAARKAAMTSLKTKYGEDRVTVLIGKIKVLRQVDGLNYHRRAN